MNQATSSKAKVGMSLDDILHLSFVEEVDGKVWLRCICTNGPGREPHADPAFCPAHSEDTSQRVNAVFAWRKVLNDPQTVFPDGVQ